MLLAYDNNLLSAVSNQSSAIFFCYDNQSHVTNVCDSYGRSCLYAYANSSLTQVVDVAGNVQRFSYDSLHRMTNYVRIDGAHIGYVYDSTNQCIATPTTEGYFSSTFQYSTQNGQKKCVDTDAVGAQTTRIFKERGMVEKTEYCDGTSTTYDHQGTRRTSFTDENGNHTSRTLLLGQVKSTTDAKGNVTTFHYDNISWQPDRLNQIDAPCGLTTHFSYDSHNNVTLVQKGTSAPDLEETHYSYDSKGRLAASWNALSQVYSNTYYENGLLKRTADPLNHFTRFAYDARGNLTCITNARGFATKIAYDSFDRPIMTIAPDGGTNKVFYDSAGRIAAIQNACNAFYSNTYNAFGLPLTTTDPLNNSITFSHDRMGRPTSTTIHDESDNSTHMSSNVYNLRGRLIKTIDPLGNETAFNYDAVGNLTNILHPESGIQDLFSFSYDKNYNLTLTKDSLGRANSVVYDAANRPLQATNALAQVVGITTYDSVGRVSTVQDRQGDPIITSFSYDLAGRRTQSTVSGAGFNLASFVAYDAVGQVTNTIDPAGYMNAFAYDPAGNVTRHINENGNASTFCYDSMNRLTYVRDPLGTSWSNVYNRIGNVTKQLPSYCPADTFAIDKLGRVAQMTSPAGSFTCSYNAANLETKQIFEDGRTNEFAYDAAYRLTSASSVPSSYAYAYDALGDLTNVLSGGAQATAAALSYGYDAAKQRTSLQLSMSNLQLTTCYSYDALGRVTGISNGFVSGTYTYDAAGNMTGKTIAAVGGSTPVVSGYSYDALDRLTNLASWIQDPASNAMIGSFAYAYEANRSLITSITDSTGGVRAFSYDPARQLTEADGQVFTYDAAGRLTGTGATNASFPTTVTTYKDGNLIGSMSYPATNTVVNLDIECVSPANVSDWTVEANGVEASSSTYHGTSTTFQINSVPLTSAWAKVTLEGKEAVTKDSDGWSEWGKHQPTNDNELHFAVESASQSGEGVFPVSPVTNTAYTYDAAGQMTGKSSTGGAVTYAYDSARNMVLCLGTGFTNNYFYDHARRLICAVRVVSGQTFTNRFVYDGLDVIAKLDETTGEMVYFTRGLGIAPGVGDILAETHILGSLTQTYIYVQNHRGDTVALVDGANETVVARYDYSAWGVITTHTGSNAFFTFSGKHYDQDAQLYYYGYRWYDAAAKRWTQPDPSGLAEGLYLYRFCGNDPLNKADSYGLQHNMLPGGGFDPNYGWGLGDGANAMAVVQLPTAPSAPTLWYCPDGNIVNASPNLLSESAYESIKVELRLRDADRLPPGQKFVETGKAMIWFSLELAQVIYGAEGLAELTAARVAASRSAGGCLEAERFGGATVTRTEQLLHRPYLRESTKLAIEDAAFKTESGEFIDPNTTEVIDDLFHYGHKPGYENWRILEEARAKGMTQKELNDWVNSHPEWFQIESPAANMSHKYEAPR